MSQSKLVQLEPGQTLISPRQLSERIYLVIEGKVRLLIQSEAEIETIDLRGPGQFLGWVSLLRASPCEWVTASEKTVVLALPADSFVKYLTEEAKFADWFTVGSTPSIWWL